MKVALRGAIEGPLDRNYVDFALLAWAVKHKRDLIMAPRSLAARSRGWATFRCATNGFAVMAPRSLAARSRGWATFQEFWQSPEDEKKVALRGAIVTLALPDTPNTRDFVHENDLPESVQVRLMKFTLPSGEIEVIPLSNGGPLTTLCDMVAFPKEEFYTIYGKRWGQETYFESGPSRGHRIKNIFEVERFRSGPSRGRGQTVESIRQDFFGIIFLATLEGVLVQPAQAELHTHDELRQNETQAKVNGPSKGGPSRGHGHFRVNSYISLVDRVVTLLADAAMPPEQTLTEIQFLLLQTPTRHKSGRQFKRLKTTPSRKNRF